MKQIPLTRGKVALVDDEDYERLIAMGKWRLDNPGYAVKSKRFRKADGKWSNKILLMHRIILDAKVGEFVDHINRDKLDNRKSNLRICSKTENNRNVGLSKNNTTGFKGVTFFTLRGKFMAQITFEGKNVFLGYFEEPKEAAKAYNNAAVKYYGEFAYLNEI